jgi:hypothetical protein
MATATGVAEEEEEEDKHRGSNFFWHNLAWRYSSV